MRRIIIALTAALAMVAGLVSVASAATLLGTAALTAGAEVLPGERQFSVRVNNNHPSDNLLQQGPRFNYVDIVLPVAAGITTTTAVQAPSGWTVEVVSRGTGGTAVESYKFRSAAGNAGIAPNSNAVFTFPANVAAPAAGDKSGDFGVFVSDDGGRTISKLVGSLTSTIRVLEVVDLGAAAPALVTDQTATSGQAITYRMTVRNHATQVLLVTPSLTSDSDDTIGNAASATINSGASTAFEFPVTLGRAGTSTFTGDATSDAANAMERRFGLEVQAAPTLVLDPAFFSPAFVKSGTLLTYTFTVQATKKNPPSLTLSDCTLSFASTTTTLASPPVNFGPGDQSAELSFKPTQVEGAEEKHKVRVQCSGTDGNGFNVSYLLENLEVTIDNTLPGVTVDLSFVSRGAGHKAVTDKDTLNIVVNVDEATQADYIRLRTNEGQEIDCAPASGKRQRHTCTVKNPPFEAGATKVLAESQVTDSAGNIGAAASTGLVVDLGVPEFVAARTTDPKQIRVEFDDQTALRGGCNPQQWTVSGHVVSNVLFSDETDCTTPPRPRGQGGPGTLEDDWSKARILVLADSLNDRDETPRVSYNRDTNNANPLADNVFDAALHQAASRALDPVVGILPPTPELTTVTRSDHETGAREDAYVEEEAGTKNKPTGDKSDKYWTNQTGSDLAVGFTGGKAQYLVQAVDANGTVLGEQQADTSGGGTISVPIGNSDGTYVRGIRFSNAAGPGDAFFFDVGLDRVAPGIVGSAINTGGDEVTVTFAEIIRSDLGTDYANDWFAWEEVEGGRKYSHPGEVTVGANDTQRKLTVSLDDPARFGGVVYLFTSDQDLTDAERYEDRAGNFLPDSAIP